MYNTFDNNFGFKNDLTKDLNENCWFCSEEDLSDKYLTNFDFTWKISLELFGCVWPLSASMN